MTSELRSNWPRRQRMAAPLPRGEAPTCRGVLLRGGAVVLTRGSSSCTISPLAKIRTILPGVRVPAGQYLSSDLKRLKTHTHKTKHQLTRDREMLAFNGRKCNSGSSHW